MKYLLILLIAILPYNFSAINISAEERLPELKKGMPYIEVIRLWGSPQEKIEKEIKRKDIWVYKNSKVMFENGSVISVVNDKGLNILLPENQIVALEKKEEKATSTTAVANQDVVDDILSEIMKDPSNAEPGDNRPLNPPPNAGIVPNSGNMINQVPPPEVIQ